MLITLPPLLSLLSSSLSSIYNLLISLYLPLSLSDGVPIIKFIIVATTFVCCLYNNRYGICSFSIYLPDLEAVRYFSFTLYVYVICYVGYVNNTIACFISFHLHLHLRFCYGFSTNHIFGDLFIFFLTYFSHILIAEVHYYQHYF